MSEETHKQAILDLLLVMRVRNNLEQMHDEHVRAQIAAGNALFVRHEPVVRRWIEKYLGFEATLAESMAIHMKHLSEEDARAAAAFYSTECGQRHLAATPAILAEMSQLGLARAAKYEPALLRMIADAQQPT